MAEMTRKSFFRLAAAATTSAAFASQASAQAPSVMAPRLTGSTSSLLISGADLLTMDPAVPSTNHVLGNGGLGNGNAKLRKLAVHTGSSPERIGSAHIPDQLAYFGSDTGSTWPTSAALPRPIE